MRRWHPIKILDLFVKIFNKFYKPGLTPWVSFPRKKNNGRVLSLLCCCAMVCVRPRIVFLQGILVQQKEPEQEGANMSIIKPYMHDTISQVLPVFSSLQLHNSWFVWFGKISCFACFVKINSERNTEMTTVLGYQLNLNWYVIYINQLPICLASQVSDTDIDPEWTFTQPPDVLQFQVVAWHRHLAGSCKFHHVGDGYS